MTMNALTRPDVALKSKLLDTVTGIAATETDVVTYDLRGCIDITFTFLATLNTGFATGTVFMKGAILGCDTPGGTFVVQNGLETAELVVDVAQIIPSTANLLSVILKRYARVRWAETGAMTSFTGTCRMNYNNPRLGRGVDHNALS